MWWTKFINIINKIHVFKQSHCNKDYCKGSIMFPSKNTSDGELLPKDIAVKDAVDFLRQYYISIKKYDSYIFLEGSR